MIAAQSAVRAWMDGYPGLTGPGNPLVLGGHLRRLRSPANGAYAVISRLQLGGGPAGGQLVAEQDDELDTAAMAFDVYAGTETAAENAAVALANACMSCRGVPSPCGSTGVVVRGTDSVTAPAYVNQPADSGEEYCFQVTATFVLQQS